MHIEIEGGR